MANAVTISTEEYYRLRKIKDQYNDLMQMRKQIDEALGNIAKNVNERQGPEMVKPFYEVRVIESSIDYINLRLAEAQKEGWEIAGNASAHYHAGPAYKWYMVIPLKRELKNT